MVQGLVLRAPGLKLKIWVLRPLELDPSRKLSARAGRILANIVARSSLLYLRYNVPPPNPLLIVRAPPLHRAIGLDS